MRKVNSKIFCFLCISIFLLKSTTKARNANIAGKEESNLFYNNNLKMIFDNLQVDTTYFNKPTILILFYKMDSINYLMIQEIPQHDPFKSRGYFLYKNYILSFYDIGEKSSERFLNIELLHTNDTVGFKKNYYDWDVPPHFYKICNQTTFVEFMPNKQHIYELNDLLLKKGLTTPPPPPPL